MCQDMGNKPVKIVQHILIHLFGSMRNNAYGHGMKLLTSIQHVLGCWKRHPSLVWFAKLLSIPPVL
jgi:hypothetical protein